VKKQNVNPGEKQNFSRNEKQNFSRSEKQNFSPGGTGINLQTPKSEFKYGADYRTDET